jgi:hypothetical protein
MQLVWRWDGSKEQQCDGIKLSPYTSNSCSGLSRALKIDIVADKSPAHAAGVWMRWLEKTTM